MPAITTGIIHIEIDCAPAKINAVLSIGTNVPPTSGPSGGSSNVAVQNSINNGSSVEKSIVIISQSGFGWHSKANNHTSKLMLDVSKSGGSERSGMPRVDNSSFTIDSHKIDTGGGQAGAVPVSYVISI